MKQWTDNRGNRPGMIAFPMHGQHKLTSEGYRTRDGHLIQWLGRLLEEAGPVSVVSRPEPIIAPGRAAFAESSLAYNTIAYPTRTKRLPLSLDRQRWWVTSLGAYPPIPDALRGCDAIVWNPFVSLSASWESLSQSPRRIVVDLLDDWSLHYAFRGISTQVEEAYRRLFARADHVTANSEDTADLAKRFGRKDVELILNGCDPEIFRTENAATGPSTIGYVGKIGKRLDLDLMVKTITSLPNAQFTFAGPIMDREYRQPLESLPNVTLLGDVHYSDVPDLLTTFDVGWVPHRVGPGEVGGDVIKTYEYRAAGLPVVSTSVLGARSRRLDEHVYVSDARDHADLITLLADDGPRVPRRLADLPESVTWKFKANQILDMLSRGTTISLEAR